MVRRKKSTEGSMVIKVRDRKRAPPKKGFRKKSPPFRVWRFDEDDEKKTPVFVTVSHGMKSGNDISEKLASSMCQQLGLVRSQLDELVECSLMHQHLKEIFGDRL